MLGTLCPTDRCRCLCGEALGFDSLVGGDPSDRERFRADENYTFVTDRCGGGATVAFIEGGWSECLTTMEITDRGWIDGGWISS